MRARFPIVAVALVLAGVALACTPPEELDADDLAPTFEWPDLMPGRDEDGESGQAFDLPSQAHGLPAAPDGPLAPERLALLPAPLRQKPLLARLAVAKGLQEPVDYQGGVFGLSGVAKVFVTTREHIKDDARLYWVMVKVLSEKYGCFMVEKRYLRDLTSVTCRDKRRIDFRTTRGADWVQFLARQYDQQGYEIVVRKRKIVRVGNERVL